MTRSVVSVLHGMHGLHSLHFGDVMSRVLLLRPLTRDGRAQYFSTSLVPLSNVPPQLFADDAERERHGCGPSRGPPSSDRVRPPAPPRDEGVAERPG